MTILRNSYIMKHESVFVYIIPTHLQIVNSKYEIFFVKEVTMEFKERIRILRREAGLTQKELAAAIGVTDRTYQNYEAGASLPPSGVLARLGEVLGVRVDMLTGGSASAPETENAELAALLAEMQALFAGGKLCDADKKYVIEALTEGYYRSKEINKKYRKK